MAFSKVYKIKPPINYFFIKLGCLSSFIFLYKLGKYVILKMVNLFFIEIFVFNNDFNLLIMYFSSDLYKLCC